MWSRRVIIELPLCEDQRRQINDLAADGSLAKDRSWNSLPFRAWSWFERLTGADGDETIGARREAGFLLEDLQTEEAEVPSAARG